MTDDELNSIASGVARAYVLLGEADPAATCLPPEVVEVFTTVVPALIAAVRQRRRQVEMLQGYAEARAQNPTQRAGRGAA